METPNLLCLNFSEEFEQVYEPAEDSFLLIDALEQDLDRIKSNRPTICLEVGCGSGVITTALAKQLKDTWFLATDVNPKACEALMKCARFNQVSSCVEAINDDLINSVYDQLKGKVDLILFNPPYVPTPDEELLTKGLSQAWAGGLDGRRVIDRFLPQCAQLLNQNGTLYLLLVKENKPNEVIQLLTDLNLNCMIVLRRKCRNEHLMIVRAIKQI